MYIVAFESLRSSDSRCSALIFDDSFCDNNPDMLQNIPERAEFTILK